jgi:hypothetical protein
MTAVIRGVVVIYIDRSRHEQFDLFFKLGNRLAIGRNRVVT